MKKIAQFFKALFLRLFRIDDTPQKIACGFGLGVFMGIFPVTGPLAALFFSWLFRINRASALLGSLLTNTWLSVLTFAVSVKISSFIFKKEAGRSFWQWAEFLRRLKLKDLFNLSVLKFLLEVILGYLLLAFFTGFLVYLVSLLIIKLRRKTKRA
ncbi:MAG: DUF2062 domain-containing protein [Candidatus Omnitrophica bacterium]|nr:DUF2062 domain-containing protein [Candidatus Omnitrophota bacterium]